jgi:hypothetical protein
VRVILALIGRRKEKSKKVVDLEVPAIRSHPGNIFVHLISFSLELIVFRNRSGISTDTILAFFALAYLFLVNSFAKLFRWISLDPDFGSLI